MHILLSCKVQRNYFLLELYCHVLLSQGNSKTCWKYIISISRVMKVLYSQGIQQDYF